MIKKPEQPWYEKWFKSPFYEKLYAERNKEEAKDFIQRLIQKLNPPKEGRILMTGCSKGKQSKMLSLLGFDVTGVDMVAANIETAKKLENDQLHFFIHDLRLPFWINYFDYAFNLFSDFGYYRTRREHNDAFRTIAASLRPTGIFVMDYCNLHFAEDNMEHNETKSIDGTVYHIHRWDDELHFYKKIKITDPSLTEPEEYIEKIMKFSLGDFTEMLAYQGLQVQEVFGDYDFSPFDIKKSPRLVIMAKEKTPVTGDEKKRLYSDGRETDALT